MKKGFTMIELMIVIAIIAILAALFVPAPSKAKASNTYQKIIDGEETTKERRKSLRSFLGDRANSHIKLEFEKTYGKLPEGWLTGKTPTGHRYFRLPHEPGGVKDQPKSLLYDRGDQEVVEKALSAPTRTEEINKLKEKIAKLSALKPFRYEIKIIGSGFITEYSLCRDNKEIMKSKDRSECESIRKHLKEAQNRGIEIGNSNNNK